MNKKLKFGFFSQGYEAPRAESIALSNEGLSCASDVLTGGTEQVVNGFGDWGMGVSGGGTESVSSKGGEW